MKLDPRTKLLLIVIVNVFVLGGAGGNSMYLLRPVLALIPFVMLLFVGRIAAAGGYLLVYSACYIAQLLWLPSLTGIWNFLLLIMSGTFCRFLPGIVTAYYVIKSTTVSEFMAGMERMHVTEKITIPMSVIFRFTPTVIEEARAIHDAMRMRGIGIGGKKSSKILEYCLIPMITCSVKIGEDLSAAALTRGLGAPVKRTNICDIGFHLQDILFGAVCVFTIVWAVISSVR
ncbi:MAG: energy-coupling factor transporter transmembrane protein EcfT [Eubacterium sp.]|nr:energy-coupling factor transporter transmembrane protein EcfT [Eubacterium sp.]